MEKYKNYLFDNISIIGEKIESLLYEKEKDDFIRGQLTSYYDIITIFKEQAEIFDINQEDIGLNRINENNILTK